MHIFFALIVLIIGGFWYAIYQNIEKKYEIQRQHNKLYPPKPIVTNKYDDRGDNSNFCGSYNDFGNYGK